MPYLKYNGTLEDLRARHIMYYAGGPYLKKGTKVKDLWPMEIDKDFEKERIKSTERPLTDDDKSWFEKNKKAFEDMLNKGEQ